VSRVLSPEGVIFWRGVPVVYDKRMTRNIVLKRKKGKRREDSYQEPMNLSELMRLPLPRPATREI